MQIISNDFLFELDRWSMNLKLNTKSSYCKKTLIAYSYALLLIKKILKV